MTFNIKTQADKDVEAQSKFVSSLTSAVQTKLDETARSLDYDNMKSARACAGVPLTGAETAEEVRQFNESVALAQWDRAVWGYMGEIKLGTKPVPVDSDELLTQIPKYGV